MYNHKIWIDVNTDAYKDRKSKSFGGNEHIGMHINAGTSAKHSERLGTVEIMARELGNNEILFVVNFAGIQIVDLLYNKKEHKVIKRNTYL